MPPQRLMAAWLGACLLASGCGPSLKTVQTYVSASPHRRIAVLPFTPAPGKPNSGQETADILGEQLSDLGFDLVDRSDLQEVLDEQKLSLSGAVRAEDAARLGRILGVRALLTGTVAESSVEHVHRPAVYDERVENVREKDGHIKQVTRKYKAIPEESADVAVFSATARLTDVETGSLLWIGSGSDHIQDDTLQEVAQSVLHKMARQLGQKFLERKL